MKLIAIGGGSNSNIKKTGEPKIYEHEAIDKEAISLSGKKNPNVLIITHGSEVEFEQIYFKKSVNIYGKMFNCPMKLADSSIINNYELNKQMIEWADIIYVRGGSTERILKLWKEYKYDELIRYAAQNEKVICGLSAGSNVLFNNCCSDTQLAKNNIYLPLKGIGLVNLATKSHATLDDINNKLKLLPKSQKENLLFLSNNMALEVVDDKYKIIEGYSSKGLPKIVALGFWKNGQYYIEDIKREGLLSDLINR